MGFDNKPGEWDSWAYPAFAQMRAAAKGQADLIAISWAIRTDVTYKTDQEMEKANRPVRFRLDVQHLRPAARARPSAHGE